MAARGIATTAAVADLGIQRGYRATLEEEEGSIRGVTIEPLDNKSRRDFGRNLQGKIIKNLIQNYKKNP
jgi:hypothetical protein